MQRRRSINSRRPKQRRRSPEAQLNNSHTPATRSEITRGTRDTRQTTLQLTQTTATRSRNLGDTPPNHSQDESTQTITTKLVGQGSEQGGRRPGRRPSPSPRGSPAPRPVPPPGPPAKRGRGARRPRRTRARPGPRRCSHHHRAGGAEEPATASWRSASENMAVRANQTQVRMGNSQKGQGQPGPCTWRGDSR